VILRNGVVLGLTLWGLALAAAGVTTYGVDSRLAFGVGLLVLAAVYARVTK
jgi:hypothetical protein